MESGRGGASSGKKGVCNKWRKIALETSLLPVGASWEPEAWPPCSSLPTRWPSLHVCCREESLLYVISTLHQGEFSLSSSLKLPRLSPWINLMACFLFIPRLESFPCMTVFLRGIQVIIRSYTEMTENTPKALTSTLMKRYSKRASPGVNRFPVCVFTIVSSRLHETLPAFLCREETTELRSLSLGSAL